MIRPSLSERLAASRRRERYLLALFSGTWGAHLIAGHASLGAQAGALLFVVAFIGIIAFWQVLGIFLDGRRFRRSPSSRLNAPARVKPESRPGDSPAVVGPGPTELGSFEASDLTGRGSVHLTPRVDWSIE